MFSLKVLLKGLGFGEFRILVDGWILVLLVGAWFSGVRCFQIPLGGSDLDL